MCVCVRVFFNVVRIIVLIQFKNKTDNANLYLEGGQVE